VTHISCAQGGIARDGLLTRKRYLLATPRRTHPYACIALGVGLTHYIRSGLEPEQKIKLRCGIVKHDYRIIYQSSKGNILPCFGENVYTLKLTLVQTNSDGVH
jgi:hypothetical protein